MLSPRKKLSQNQSSNYPVKHSPRDTGWGGVADWYDSHLQSGNSYHETLVWPNLIRLLGGVKGKKILDLACGTGFFAHKLAELGAEVTGVDISPELIDKAKFGCPTAKFFVTPADDLSVLGDTKFDHIINILAIDNIAEVGEMLQECSRVLDKGSKMHVVLNHPAFRNPSNSSWGYDERKHIQYRRLDKYMSESRVKIAMQPGKEAEGKIGQSTTTFHRPLQAYFRLFKEAGFAVSNLEEWCSNKVSEKGPRQKAEDQARKEFPLFLYLQLSK
jgi:ubiquinone/menaquinone biosynthesis C-methylase UbiE